MEYISLLKEFGENVKNYSETKNFYYENHNCPVLGNNTKVKLDYTLINDETDKVLRFGICGGCKTCFYHYDFISKRF